MCLRDNLCVCVCVVCPDALYVLSCRVHSLFVFVLSSRRISGRDPSLVYAEQKETTNRFPGRRHERVLNVLSEVKAGRVSCLIGQEEQDHDKEYVDDTLLQDFFHLDFFHSELTSFLQCCVIWWRYIARSQFTLFYHFCKTNNCVFFME